MTEHPEDILFSAATPVGIWVRVGVRRWQTIVREKHPVMADQLDQVISALKAPDEVRQSKHDKEVFLFYKAVTASRWVCAVVKQFDDDGFLITAYPTDAIKEGVRIWPK